MDIRFSGIAPNTSARTSIPEIVGILRSKEVPYDNPRNVMSVKTGIVGVIMMLFVKPLSEGYHP